MLYRLLRVLERRAHQGHPRLARWLVARRTLPPVAGAPLSEATAVPAPELDHDGAFHEKAWCNPSVIMSHMTVTPEHLAATLLRRERRAREAASERAERLRGRLSSEVAALLGRGLAHRAWLIGSLAWGTFGLRSDVDLVLEGLPAGEATSVRVDMSDRLGAEVDLLRLEDLPESFRRRVVEEGIPLHVS